MVIEDATSTLPGSGWLCFLMGRNYSFFEVTFCWLKHIRLLFLVWLFCFIFFFFATGRAKRTEKEKTLGVYPPKKKVKLPFSYVLTNALKP